jgi:hypothetical protein
MMTTYTEATVDDRDVAAFLAAHPYDLNLFELPCKLWVARDGATIVAVLMLKTTPYVALDLIRNEAISRPFMRVWKLWKVAEAWLRANKVPIICASIPDHLTHYQSLVARAGFEIIGVHPNSEGIPVETIFAKALS